MALLLNYLGILACLMLILVYVDSKSNQHHSPNDRVHHNRPHNLHRAPYKGYDWSKHGYKLNFNPITGLPKDKKRGRTLPRSFRRSGKDKLNAEDLKRILHEGLTPQQEEEYKKLQDTKEKIDKQMQQIFNTDSYTDQFDKLFGFDFVASLLASLVDKGTFPRNEAKPLAYDKIKDLSEFYYLFQEEFAGNPQADQAFKKLVEEVEKPKRRSKTANFKLRRSKGHSH